MAEAFVKFPRTPHLAWLGITPPRGDKLLSSAQAAAFLTEPVVVEEKLDGACVGLSLGPDGSVRAQHRGGYLTPRSHAQFQTLWAWLAEREVALREALGARLILFGEWCYARHSVVYDALPDWFMAFDVYDRKGARFWSRARRDALIGGLPLASAPMLACGRFDRTELERLLGRSYVGSAPMEGIYLRREDGPWLTARAKLVRASWIPHNELHWSRRAIRPNRRVGDFLARAAEGGRG
ncbi:MAG TPA: RNA ligase family protein [Candidatus Acidoferrum sp.]|nr:RNA ligase family protein [Candidatus Acidoferrum sp.]